MNIFYYGYNELSLSILNYYYNDLYVFEECRALSNLLHEGLWNVFLLKQNSGGSGIRITISIFRWSDPLEKLFQLTGVDLAREASKEETKLFKSKSLKEKSSWTLVVWSFLNLMSLTKYLIELKRTLSKHNSSQNRSWFLFKSFSTFQTITCRWRRPPSFPLWMLLAWRRRRRRRWSSRGRGGKRIRTRTAWTSSRRSGRLSTNNVSINQNNIECKLSYKE